MSIFRVIFRFSGYFNLCEAYLLKITLNWETDFIRLQCWEVLPFWRIQHQWYIKFRVLRAQDFYMHEIISRVLGGGSGERDSRLEGFQNWGRSEGLRKGGGSNADGVHRIPNYAYSGFNNTEVKRDFLDARDLNANPCPEGTIINRKETLHQGWCYTASWQRLQDYEENRA